MVKSSATGARRGELFALTWDRVHLDRAKPHLLLTQTKGKRDRKASLTPPAVRSFRRLLGGGAHIRGPFAGMEDNANRTWVAIRKEARIDDVTIHDLRRPFITERLRAGIPVQKVKDLVGHMSVSTTLGYYYAACGDDLHEAAMVPRVEDAR